VEATSVCLFVCDLVSVTPLFVALQTCLHKSVQQVWVLWKLV